MTEAAVDEAGRRVRIFRGLRRLTYGLAYKGLGRNPVEAMGRTTAHYAEVGSATRCMVCGLSIRGPLGWLNRSFWGIAPLSKHPDLCNVCRVGERLLEVTVLFADARGFTQYAERRPADEVAGTINKMFDGCIRTLLEHDAIVDKMMGDAVMAVFGAPIVRPDHTEQAVQAAVAIQENAVRMFPPEWEGACLRIGLNTGTAFLGRLGSGDVKDYTAVGDTVNVAQRLQVEAEPGEILVSAAVYEQVRNLYPRAVKRELAVKGRDQRVDAYALAKPSA